MEVEVASESHSHSHSHSRSHEAIPEAPKGSCDAEGASETDATAAIIGSGRNRHDGSVSSSDGDGDEEEDEAFHVVMVLKDEAQAVDESMECRVCHLSLAEAAAGASSISISSSAAAAAAAIRLGCHCKEGLALAHRSCAEAWFKLKGNRVCEICGAPAQNVVGMEEDGSFMAQWNDMGAGAGGGGGGEGAEESHGGSDCWQSLSLCNFLLACMVVIFILLWLFRISIA